MAARGKLNQIGNPKPGDYMDFTFLDCGVSTNIYTFIWCWNGDVRGGCRGNWNPCDCRTHKAMVANITAQSGDVFVLTLSTMATESSTSNNTAQATL